MLGSTQKWFLLVRRVSSVADVAPVSVCAPAVQEGSAFGVLEKGNGLASPSIKSQRRPRQGFSIPQTYDYLLPPPPAYIPLDLNSPRVTPKSEDVYTETSLSATELGRFEKVSSAAFFGESPEGVPPSLKRDFSLCKTVYDYFGMMLRAPTLQVIKQLEMYKNLRDRRTGRFAIPYEGFLLDGVKGAGKSVALQHIVWWAKKHGWIVVYEPEPDKYLRKCDKLQRTHSGLYVQAAFARTFLEKLMKANEKKLADSPIHWNIYGKCGLDGASLSWGRQVFDPLIQRSTKNQLTGEMRKEMAKYKDELSPNDLEKVDCSDELSVGKLENGLILGLVTVGNVSRECTRIVLQKYLALLKRKLYLSNEFSHLIYSTRLIDKLPNPKNLLDIASFGVENEGFALLAVAELLHQLKRQTRFPVLMAIDNFNMLFHVSKYVSIRYDLTRYQGYIPGYHLALPRLLCRWDGANFARGVQVAALSWGRVKRENFSAPLLGINQKNVVGIPQFSAYEFDRYVRYLVEKTAIEEFPEKRIPYYYTMTSKLSLRFGDPS